MLAMVGLVATACDTEPKDGLFGASAAGPSMPTASAGTGSDADDPDTEGASDDSRADSGGGDSSGGDSAQGDSAPADSNGDPAPPPAEDEGGTFDPLDDGGMDAAGSTSFGDDGGAATSDGGGLPGDCCSASIGAGCSDPAVEACVCGQDSFCCDSQWDEICAQIAGGCGGNCAGGGAGGACCMVQAAPGCGDLALENCVCSFDAFCCTTQWDEVCVQEAQVDCGAAC